tara:strand:+ start:588 stop:761 length:174 start_codon:yes stop_codon:yes gene_type:complete
MKQNFATLLRGKPIKAHLGNLKTIKKKYKGRTDEIGSAQETSTVHKKRDDLHKLNEQ